MEHLHLFTDIKQEKPVNNTSHLCFKQFYESGMLSRQSIGYLRFDTNKGEFYDTNDFGSKYYVLQVTHWLDLSKLTTKEREEKLIDACRTVKEGYEDDGMENMQERDYVFYEQCIKALDF